MMKKTRIIDKKFLEKEKKNWGQGTIVCHSWEEFEELAEKSEGGGVSPGGAADFLGVSRSYVHQLEKEGKIRAFRIVVDDEMREHMPFWLKVFTPAKAVYIIIPQKDLEKVKKEMIKRAEEKIKRLKGKK
ncbi:hypothetical protein NBG4_500025 [Candidatus Sulfobium mesophilum]|uniref:Uncharacterized protein n=1 Tax=Candidatus Sulfobium mesophilum TaxID=2016548 RepID=A0A2U3QIV6_9BACT|nr:hypothetical protein NBG4_500025 [Candidatus Sulfobium mesophilum]